MRITAGVAPQQLATFIGQCPGEGLIEPYESVLDELLYLLVTEGAHLCLSTCQDITFQPFQTGVAAPCYDPRRQG